MNARLKGTSWKITPTHSSSLDDIQISIIACYVRKKINNFLREKSLEKIKEAILESAGWKTFFSVIIPILTGVLSGTFVSEISVKGVITWANFYKTISFYGLSLITIVIYFYNKSLFIYEKETLRFLDSDYCVAYMRSKCLPEAAERYKQLIRNGEGGEFKQAMDELKRVLK